MFVSEVKCAERTTQLYVNPQSFTNKNWGIWVEALKKGGF